MKDSKLYATSELEKIRKEKELTQPEMAELLEMLTGKSISSSSYQKWEQGTQGVKPEVAIKICKVLNVSIKLLWQGHATKAQQEERADEADEPEQIDIEDAINEKEEIEYPTDELDREIEQNDSLMGKMFGRK